MWKKRITKWISLLLCVVLLVSILPATATAAAGTLSGAQCTAKAGETVDFTVSLADNPGLMSFRIKLSYDTAVLSLEPGAADATTPACTQGNFTTRGTMLAGYTATGGQVMWYHTGSVSGSGALFTVRLRVSADAPAGEYPVRLSYVADDTINAEEEPVALACLNGCVTVRSAAPSLRGESAEVERGTVTDYTISVQDNPGLAGCQLLLTYDTAALALVVDSEDPTAGLCTAGSSFAQGTMLCAPTATGCRVLWYATSDVTADGVLAKVRLRTKDDAPYGTYPVALSYVEGDTLNAAEERVSLNCLSGSVKVIPAAGWSEVVYDANGGGGAPTRQTKEAGKPLTLSSAVPTRTGYTFMGWAAESTAAAATYNAGGVYTADADVTLYAVWQGICPSQMAVSLSAGPYYTWHDITFTPQAVDAVSFTCRITRDTPAGTTVKEIAEPFTGAATWRPEEAGTYCFLYTAHSLSGDTAQAQQSFTVTDLTLETPQVLGSDNFYHVYYMEVDNAQSYDVYLVRPPYTWDDIAYTVHQVHTGSDGRGGAQVSAQFQDVTSAYYRAFVVARPGPDALDITKSGRIPNGCQPVKYTVSYHDASGCAVPEDQSKEAYVPLTLCATVPERAGYRFAGWASDPQAQTASYQPGSSYIGNEALSLYALWESTAPAVQAVIDVGDIQTAPGKTVTLPVSIRNNPGISGFTLGVDYDTACMQLTAIEKGELTTGGIFAPNSADGFVSWVTDSNVAQDGTLCLLTFTIANDCADGDHSVSVSLVDGEASNLTNDALQVVSARFEAGAVTTQRIVPGDVTGDRLVTAADAVKLVQYLARLVTLTEDEIAAADVTGDGVVTSVDAVKLVRFLAHLEEGLGGQSATVLTSPTLMSAPPLLMSAPQPVEPTIALPDTYAVPGSEITVPVEISDNTGVAGFSFEIKYDETALTLRDIQRGDQLSAGLFVPNALDQRVVWASAEEYRTDGVLFYLRFTVTEAARGAQHISVCPADGLASNLSDKAYNAVCAAFRGGTVRICPAMLSDSALQNGKVSYTLRANDALVDIDSLQTIAALYLNGQMVHCQQMPSQPGQPVALTYQGAFDEVRLFLLDDQFCPVGPSAHIHNG